METITVNTFWANIYVGLKDTDLSKTNGYEVNYPIGLINGVCQEYCDDTGFCVTVTPTTFRYTKGTEKGAIVGIINYPRFPDSAVSLECRAIKLGEMLREACNQYRVTVVMPHQTVMLCRLNTEENPKLECPRCHCLTSAHHGPRIGCEGAGGNCGCELTKEEIVRL